MKATSNGSQAGCLVHLDAGSTNRGPRKKKRRKTTQAAKKFLTSIKEKRPLGKKSPFTRKEESSQ